MIVQCQSCQTKFRVPDEKFGEKPVKVRCSKCQSVFAVRRLADGTAQPVGGAAPPPAAAGPASVAPPPAPPADPFASFGPPPEVPSGEKTSRGVWHAGIAATRPQADPDVTRPGVNLKEVLASAGPQPRPNLAVSPEAGLFEQHAGLDGALDGLVAPAGPPPLPPPAAPPPPAAAPAFEDPFGDLDLAAAPPVPAAPVPAAPVPFPAADPFAQLSSEVPGAAPAADPFGDLDLAAAPALPTGGAESFSFEHAPDPSAAPSPAAAGFFDIPDAAPPSHAHPPDAGDEATHTEPDRSFFDLPAAPPPTPAAAALESAPGPGPTSLPRAEEQRPRPAARAKPPSRAAPVVGPRPLGPRVLGAVLNGLFVLAVGWGSLLTYAAARADWHFDPALLRPAELGRAIFGAKTAAAQLVLEDVASGRYPMKDGKEVFFVRGQVVNRGKSPLGPARAHIELVEGDRVLAQTEAWAGVPFTPEQVYNLTDAVQLRALEQQQQAQARPLNAGEGQPFVALLLDPPAELSRASLRVTSDLGPHTP